MADDKLSLAIGRRGQNVRLAARITGWDVDVFAPRQFEERWSRGKAELMTLPGVGEEGIRAFVEMGLAGYADIVDGGSEKLMQVEGMDEAKAKVLYEFSILKERERIEQEKIESAARAAEAAAAAAAEVPAEGAPPGGDPPAAPPAPSEGTAAGEGA